MAGIHIEKKSESYQDLYRSSFPGTEDNFDIMQDVTQTLMPLIVEYNSYFAQGNMNACNELLANNPDLVKCFFNADKWNKLRDAILAIERYYLEEVETFINLVAQNTIGLNDNPTEEESLTTSYSSNKVDTLLREEEDKTDKKLETLDSTIKEIITNTENDINAQIKKMNSTVVVELPVSGWSNTLPYTQRVAVAGIKETDEPDIHLYTPKTLPVNEVKLRQKFTGMITDGETEDGYATFYCGAKKPTADFSILLKGVNVNE